MRQIYVLVNATFRGKNRDCKFNMIYERKMTVTSLFDDWENHKNIKNKSEQRT